VNIGFLPVRGGSKSIPLKNIKNFCGVPLLWYALEALENSFEVDMVVVATDHEDISNLTRYFNSDKPTMIYDRDPENAMDDSSTESVMLEFLGKCSFKDDDDILLVQATNPFLLGEDIDHLMDQYYVSGADSALTVAQCKSFIWSSKGQPHNYSPYRRPRRQDWDGYNIENGAAYVCSVGGLLLHKSRLHGQMELSHMKGYTMIELDESDDWKIAEAIMERLQEDRVAKLRERFCSLL